MASEKASNYDVTFNEFSEWTANQSWLLLSISEGQDSGAGQYTYLTPTGTRLIVTVKNDKVLTIAPDNFSLALPQRNY